jgi:hypothetical protein
MPLFPTLEGDLRQALRERIDACEALLEASLISITKVNEIRFIRLICLFRLC